MKVLDAPLSRILAFTEADERVRRNGGPVLLTGCAESQKVHVMNQAGQGKARLIVTYDERQARALFEDLEFFSEGVFYFPAKDLLFYQADLRSNTITTERIRVLRALREGKARAVVTTFAAMMNVLPDTGRFDAGKTEITEGAVVEPEALALKLVSLGYERVGKVEEPGQFAIHGGIFDVFDLTEENPFRIEFFDDEVDSIRIFNAETQVTITRIQTAAVYPAAELLSDPKDFRSGYNRIEKDYQKSLKALKDRNDYEAAAALQSLMREVTDSYDHGELSGILEGFLPYFVPAPASLLSYFEEPPVICLEEPLRLREFGRLTETEFTESFRQRIEKGLALPEQAKLLRRSQDVFALLETPETLLFTALDQKITMMRVAAGYGFECQSVVSYKGNFQGLLDDMKRYQRLKYSVVLLCASRTRGRRLSAELSEYGLHAYVMDSTEEEVVPGTIGIIYGNLHKGWSYPQLKFIVLTESDIAGRERKKRRPHEKFENGQKIRNFSELSVGDYVVHENYGIGIYQGITGIETEGVKRDYMKISYLKSGTLYVPVANLDVVQKYASKEAKPPRINRLDSPDWKKTRTRVRAAVEEVADELVELYALRQNGTGYRYSEDTVWQKEIEELFPFEETDDQLAAIRAVKEDMESGKIMDRLLCGDVGFGKTEVALRAAFKAVMDGKQVAYLVPTTILADQHYKTFTQRLKDYPVSIEMLSRFRTGQEQTAVLNKLKRGGVDIVIGTHRLLSKDVEFRDLGLLIIDEEQRFGVKHKEKIKQLRMNVDVLTLTATPIPRTLHMSMIGVRDMSLLEEAPLERMPIQTYVMEYSEELVREAIHRELARGGQVYYVYNRVQDIADVAAKIAALVPEAAVSFAHGKMGEQELEREMLAFVEGEIDVLVSTTIIETGLDIPNVNTIIVHDAERYGLAQLYQLRGRVGRSSRQAYAFIMYRRDRMPGEEASKRLETIRQYTELGSGIRIAMQDLQLRGAGAVLGNAQSGHMAEVGYELYCKMLSEAVRVRKGEEVREEETDTLLDIPVDAYIPAAYISSEPLKLEIYKRISLITSEEDCENLSEELVDRFGDVPRQVENLMKVAHLRAVASSMYMTEIKGNVRELRFKFAPDAKVRAEGIPELIAEMKGEMRFIQGEAPGLLYRRRSIPGSEKEDVLEVLKNLLIRTKQLII